MPHGIYISVLDGHPLSFMNIHECTTFQQDSAPCHKAKSVTNWFQTKNVRRLKWPGNSPDLNPNENLWTLIKKKVSTSNPTALDELKRTVKRLGAKILIKMSAQTLQIPCLAAFRKLLKTRATTPILVQLLQIEPCWRCLDCLEFVSSFVTFNKRKNVKMCHFCVFSAFEKIFQNFFPVL